MVGRWLVKQLRRTLRRCKLTDPELNQAMAESCGWRFLPSQDVAGKAYPDTWVKDEMEYFEDRPYPKYTECLNATAQAFEQCINPSEELSRKYWLSLSTITKTKSPEGLIKIMLSITEATARQRCVAILTALGKYQTNQTK